MAGAGHPRRTADAEETSGELWLCAKVKTFFAKTCHARGDNLQYLGTAKDEALGESLLAMRWIDLGLR